MLRQGTRETGEAHHLVEIKGHGCKTGDLQGRETPQDSSAGVNLALSTFLPPQSWWGQRNVWNQVEGRRGGEGYALLAFMVLPMLRWNVATDPANPTFGIFCRQPVGMHGRRRTPQAAWGWLAAAGWWKWGWVR